MGELLDDLFGKSNAVDPMDAAEDKEPKQEEPVEAEEETKQEETPEPEPEAEEPKEEEPKQEERKKIPFDANHPRFKRVWAELEELRAWKEEQTRKSQEAPQVAQQSQPAPTADMPQEFIDLFGENREAWEKFRKLSLTPQFDIRSEVQKVLDEQRQQELARKQAEEQAQQQAVQATEEMFYELSEETGIDMTDRGNTVRNQILSIVEKYNLFNENGLPNVRAAHELHAALYPQSNNVVEEKRKVVAKTNVKTNSSAKESDFYTPQKLREIQKLGGIHFFKNS